MSLPSLKEKSQKKGLKNVFFAGRVQYEEMEELYAMSDLLLIHLKNDPLFRITIPHKLLTYLSVGKPIVSAVTGEVNNIVEKSSSGFTCESEDAKSLAKIVIKASRLTDQNKSVIYKKSKIYFNEHFSKKVLTGKWHNLISKSIIRKQN